MKHFNHRSLLILPVLSILSISPMALQSHPNYRGIASVVEDGAAEEVKEVKEFKKFNEYSAKVDPKNIVHAENLSVEDLKKQDADLKAKLQDKKIPDDKKEINKDVVAQDRKDRESLVVDLLLLEDGLGNLEEKKSIEITEADVLKKSILEHKGQIEELLLDLEKSEEILAQKEEPKKEEEEVKPVIADEEPKKDEPAKDGPKDDSKEEVVVAEDKKEDKEVCEAEEKNALLTKQVEQLLNDQKQIMQTMLGMAQMMISMHQNQNQQQQNPYYANSYHANPYQYNQPFTSGNWVYYPNGFQPSQPNIFAQPQQQPGQQPLQQGGIYPSQMHQQSNWNLAPQYQFQADPRYTVAPIMPGDFGIQPFTYNLSNQGPSNPMPGQMPMSPNSMMNPLAMMSR